MKNNVTGAKKRKKPYYYSSGYCFDSNIQEIVLKVCFDDS
jgi:hypothetical protein